MTFTLYQSVDGQWRWRLAAKNGNIIACSSESYKAKAAARHGIRLVKSSSHAPVKLVTIKPAPKEEPVVAPAVVAPVASTPEIAAVPAV